jgi:hypothetical protein
MKKSYAGKFNIIVYSIFLEKNIVFQLFHMPGIDTSGSGKIMQIPPDPDPQHWWIRYCLNEHGAELQKRETHKGDQCKSSDYLLASSSSRVNMESSRADGSSLNKHKLKGQSRKIGNSFTNLKLFLGLAFSPEIFWLESLQDIQERMKGFLAHNRMTVLGLSEK